MTIFSIDCVQLQRTDATDEGYLCKIVLLDGTDLTINMGVSFYVICASHEVLYSAKRSVTISSSK